MLPHSAAVLLLLAPSGAYLLSPSRAPHRALLSSTVFRHETISACDESDDLNWLQTKLNKAVCDEDYEAAAQLRDRIEGAAGVAGICDWAALGVPTWMDDWLQRLGFAMPTRVQLQALRALPSGEDAAICADTGSGKTLAYLVPIIASLSEDLMQEDLSLFLSAALRGGQSVQWAREQAKADQSEAEMQTPSLLIVVPTRELGVQTSLTAYRLLGGGESNPTIQPYAHPSRYRPGAKANMFNYDGPRHVRVAGLWDEQTLSDPNEDILKGVHVIVGTPYHLARAALSGKLTLQHLRYVVVDEADEVLGESAEDMASLLSSLTKACDGRRLPQTVLAGASLSPTLVQRGADAGWVRAPTLVTDRGAVEAVTELEVLRDAAAAPTPPPAADIGSVLGSGPVGGWLQPRVHAGHSHEYLVCPPAQQVATLCRLLRSIFETDDGYTDRPRVIVFAPSAEAAVDTASRLQGALWSSLGGDTSAGLWGLSVLLPSSEEERLSTKPGQQEETLSILESSLRVMEMFRANQTSVLVTTVAATRGLDFPDVTDVFNLGIVGSAADYLHRAGRVGRIGQSELGRIISVLQPAEVSDLLDLSTELRFTPRERELPSVPSLANASNDRDGAVQTLTEIFSLYN